MRKGRVVTTLLVVVSVQLVLVAGYLLLRDEGDPASLGLERPSPEVGDLRWESVGGAAEQLSGLGEPVIVHLWATWCGPCREELPELLAFAEDSPVRVVAVTVDPEWSVVREFLGGDIPPSVVRADGEEVTGALGTQNLPETWVIGADGRARARLRGAGDWSDDQLRETVIELARD